MKWCGPFCTAFQLCSLLGIISAAKEEDSDSIEQFETATASDVPIFVSEDVPACKWQARLTISARNFPATADSMCIVLAKSDSAAKWVELARTEIVEEDGDPDFVQKVTLDYTFEAYFQPILFKCYKIEVTSLELKHENLFGYASVTLGAVDNAGPAMKLNLESASDISPLPKSSSDQWWESNKRRRLSESGVADSGKPYIIVTAEKIKNCNTRNADHITLVLRGSNILVPPRSRSTSYLNVYQARGDIASEAEMLMTRLAVPEFMSGQQVSVSFAVPDPAYKLKFVCKYRCGRTKQLRVVGQFETSVSEIENSGRRTFELIDPRVKKSDIYYQHSGVIHIVKYHGIFHSFLEYLRGGLKIHFYVGIDFTNSKIDGQLQADTEDWELNDYERAMCALITVIEEYNSDKSFPLLGFGALSVSHEDEGIFYVDSTRQFGDGIHGVLDAYRRRLSRIKVTEPPRLAPIIRHVAHKYVRGHERGDDYFILLILTDGHIEDVVDAQRTIKEAAALPLSIIVVGIGDEDEFQSVAELGALPSSDELGRAEIDRDIVHFIAFKQFIPTTKRRLTKELLAEVPGQLVTYMANRRLQPNAPLLTSAELPPHPGYL